MDMDRTEQLEEEVRRLNRLVEEMRGRLVMLEGTEAAEGKSPRSSRRGFLRLGAAAAAGAVGMAAARVLPVAAADGATVTTGSATTGETPTTITGDGSANATTGATGNPIPVFAARANGFVSGDLTTALGTNDSFNAPLQGLGPSGVTAIGADGVDGWAQGPLAFAVYGLSDQGVGVVGEALTGIGVYARGTGRLKQDPQGIAGDPTSSFPNGPDSFEQVRDANGVLFIHGTGSGAGNSIWRRVNTLRTDAASGNGHAFKPFRLADTRNGTGGFTGPFGDGTSRTYTVAGTGSGDSSVPTDAIAVVGNLTATGFGSAGGFMAIHPAGTTFNASTDPSSLNFSGSVGAWANSFVCGLGTGANAGKITVDIKTYSGSKTQFIIDITGYIQ
jgi:hypothetical protein